MKKILGAFAVLATVSLGTPAYAGELRAGIWEHDAEFFGLGGKKGKETSESVSLEYVFDAPEILGWARSPRPFVGAMVNFSGNTNFGSAGLLWQGKISDRFYVEYATGLSVNDGTRTIPSPNNETDAAVIADLVNRKATEIEFGANVLFRNAFAFGFNLDDSTGIEIVWEHHSHAKLFSSVNEGIDNAGIRVAKRF